KNPAGAEAAYRRASELKPDLAQAHYHLGVALREQGKWAEAEAPYRKAIELKPDYAEAHCNLGEILQRKGRFTEALAPRRRAHEFGPNGPGWPSPPAQWVRQA